MKLTLLVTLSLCFSSIASAASRQDIAELLRSNRQALQSTEADSAQLDEVAAHLEEALAILDSGEGSADQSQCLDFATATYKSVGYNSAQSFEKAMNICKLVFDMKFVQYATDKYKSVGYNAAQSLEKAVALQSKDLKGKTQITEFIFEKYKSVGYNAAQSLEKSVALAKQIQRRNFDCIQTAYSNYVSSGYNAVQSVEKAAAICQ